MNHSRQIWNIFQTFSPDSDMSLQVRPDLYVGREVFLFLPFYERHVFGYTTITEIIVIHIAKQQNRDATRRHLRNFGRRLLQCPRR